MTRENMMSDKDIIGIGMGIALVALTLSILSLIPILL